MDSGGSYAATIDKSESSGVEFFKAVVIDDSALNPKAKLAALDAAQSVIGINHEYPVSAMKFLSSAEGYSKVLLRFWMRMRSGERIRFTEAFALQPSIERGSLAGILHNGRQYESTIDLLDLPGLSYNVSPQLPFGGSLSALYETSGGPPQRDRGEKQKGGEGRNQRIGDFKPVATERRPELGSVLFGIGAFAVTFPITAFAQDLWDGGRRWWSIFLIYFCGLLGLRAVVGLLFDFDFWGRFL